MPGVPSSCSCARVPGQGAHVPLAHARGGAPVMRPSGTSRLPWTATALSFLEPMTAPSPERPAARPLLFITEAMRASFSPAGPMQATCRSLPCSCLRISSVSKVSLPQIAGGVSQLGHPVVDVQVDGLLRDPGEEHRVVAGELEVGPEVPARIGVAPTAGQGRLAHDDVPRAADAVGAGQRGR